MHHFATLVHLLLVLQTLPSALSTPPPPPIIPYGALHATPFQTCPCIAKVSMRSAHASAMDVLVIRREDLEKSSLHATPHISDVPYLQKHSRRNVTRTSNVLHNSHLHHIFSPDFYIDEPGEFTLMLAPVASASFPTDFSLSLTQRTSVTCDIILGEDPNPQRLLERSEPRSTSISRAMHQSSPGSVSRIVGGSRGAAFEVLIMASIVSSDNRMLCGGTIIAENAIITAAHCRVTNTSKVKVQGSSFDNGTEIAVERVITHEEWNEEAGFKFDIALVILKEPISDVAPAILNGDPNKPETAAYGRVMGYGQFVANDRNSAGELNFVDIPVISSQDCEAAHRDSEVLEGIDSELQFCAGFKDGGCGACTGDSGGPVIELDFPGRPVLVGIISVPRDCARANSPGVYTRVSSFQEWIMRQNISSARFGSNINSQYADSSFRQRIQTGAIVGFGVVIGVLVITAVVLLVIVVRKERNYLARDQNLSDSDEFRGTHLLSGQSTGEHRVDYGNTN